MFISQAGGAVITATIRPDGTGPFWVTHHPAGGPLAFGNSYSPDARWIVLLLENDGLYALCKTHPDGSVLQQITSLSTFRPRGMAWGSATWRPAGTRRAPAGGPNGTYVRPVE